jgi:hypothetical protein
MRRYVVRSLLLGVLALGLVMGLATGVQAQNGTKTIFAKALLDHECNAAEWHFVITQIRGAITAPASIHVIWANGAQADVPLERVTGQVAHYTTTANLMWQVLAASAVIDEEWSGQFNLSHGPCDVIGPGKGTDLSILGTVLGNESGFNAPGTAADRAHSGHAAPSNLPKTGDADLRMAALAASLLGMGLLATGFAGRRAGRRV